MNFLAHLYLSGESIPIMVGNFIGDFVKGNQLKAFDPAVQKGILLHREIDHFADQSKDFLVSKKRLYPNYHHYAGVIVDLYYDHFLARNWSRFSQTDLPDFTKRAYQVILENAAILPEKVKQFLPFMIHGNWLVNYGKIEGIGNALAGMARRTKFDSKMELASQDLEQKYSEFEQDFLSFFPTLIQFSDNWLKEHQLPGISFDLE